MNNTFFSNLHIENITLYSLYQNFDIPLIYPAVYPRITTIPDVPTHVRPLASGKKYVTGKDCIFQYIPSELLFPYLVVLPVGEGGWGEEGGLIVKRKTKRQFLISYMHEFIVQKR